MTVGELIDLLQKMPRDLEVVTPTGDCDDPSTVSAPSIAWVSESGLVWRDGDMKGDRKVVKI